MAKWENLKTAVAAVVKTNGNKEITGANMQAVLNSIINAVGGNAGFAGIATPTTNPSGIPDGPTFYIATQGGTYSYFPTDGQSTPAIIQDGVISVLYNQGNGLWVVTTTPMSIADGSVTTGKLATGAVTGEKIADNAVGTNKIANNSVTAPKIANESISQSKLQFDAVGTDNIRDNAITTSKIAQEAVGNQQLATNSVTGEKIGDGSIITSKIANGAVTGEKIANGTITGAKIADGTITGNEIAPNSIESSNLGYGAVDNEILADGAVTTDKLAPFAVDTGNIENKAVTKGKLDDDVVAILDEVDNKANIDGFYDTMGVGTARNLLGKTSVVDTFFRKIIGVGVAKGNGYVNGVRGNSIVWNQLVNPSISVALYCTAQFNNGTYQLTSASNYREMMLRYDIPLIKGHKYYQGLRLLSNNIHNYYFQIQNENWQQVDRMILNQIFLFDDDSTIQHLIYCVARNSTEEVTTAEISCPFLFDLTAMDIDNLTTTEEVEAWLAANVGKADYYAYNTGELLSTKMQSIKTVGFNQWDEELLFNKGLNSQGVVVNTNNYQTTSLIHVIGGMTYYLQSPKTASFCCFYDENGNWISNRSSITANTTFDVPEGASYMRLQFYNYGSTYNNDICINFSNSALNGTYTPYQTQTKALSVTTLTGNHLGTRSTIFPNGMRRVGNGYDEISGNSAIIRIACVKVSELEWVFVEDSVFVANIPTRKYGNGIIVLCDKYASQPRGVDKGIYAHTITDSVLVMDTAYQSVAAFKSAMGDATILFELAEPIEYTDLMDEQDNDFSLPISIEVEPLGTLETLPQNTEGEALAMCAPTLSMQFSIDAAKILTDELPNEYRTNADDKANWNKFLAIMNDKLGSTMGGTISVDDAAVGHGLDFTFAAAQAENNSDVEPIEE